MLSNEVVYCCAGYVMCGTLAEAIRGGRLGATENRGTNIMCISSVTRANDNISPASRAAFRGYRWATHVQPDKNFSLIQYFECPLFVPEETDGIHCPVKTNKI